MYTKEIRNTKIKNILQIQLSFYAIWGYVLGRKQQLSFIVIAAHHVDVLSVFLHISSNHASSHISIITSHVVP